MNSRFANYWYELWLHLLSHDVLRAIVIKLCQRFKQQFLLVIDTHPKCRIRK